MAIRPPRLFELYGAASYGGPGAYGYPPAAPSGMGYGPMPGAYPPYPMR